MLEDFLTFYKGKRIFITGHTGFVGSWLTKWLIMLGAEVSGYSLEPAYEPNLYGVLSIEDQIKHVAGDIRDKASLQDAIKAHSPDIVFHLAAQPIVLDAFENPAPTFETNVNGTVYLLDILRKTQSVKEIIVMTSDKTYRNNEWVYPYREIDPLGGKDPYSASKSCQDIVVDSFRESYFKGSGLGISSVRAGNIIGGGDWSPNRILPDLVRGAIENRPVMIRNPDSVRPWQFILDPLAGILKLAFKMWEDPSYSGAWNFGPTEQKAVTVSSLVESFVQHWGLGEYFLNKDDSTKESHFLQLDVSKAMNELGWQQIYNFNEGMKKTVDWYKQFYSDKSSIDPFTSKQINEYMLNFRSKK